MDRADVVEMKKVLPLFAAATPQGDRSLSKGMLVLIWSGVVPRISAATCAVVVSMGLTAIGRASVRSGAVLFQFNGRAVDAAGTGRLFHLGKIAMSRAALRPGFDADDADAHKLSRSRALSFALRAACRSRFFPAGWKQSGIVATVVDVAADRAVGHFVGLDQIFRRTSMGLSSSA